MYRCIRLGGSVCLAAAMLLTAAAVTVAGAFSDREKAEKYSDSVALPVLMYHSVVKDSRLAGEHVITADELESDIVRLIDEGYTPVTCREVRDYVLEDGALPERPIVLTFDDGFFNNFMYVLPLLEKYDICGVFSVTGKWTEEAAQEENKSPVYSYMDTDCLRTLILSGRCELAVHGWDMHSLVGRRGMLQKGGESDEDYRRALWSDLSAVKKLLTVCGQQDTVTLAYPYGFADGLTEQLTEQAGYTVTLGCEEGINLLEKGDENCLRMMKRYNRASGRDVLSEIDESLQK